MLLERLMNMVMIDQNGYEVYLYRRGLTIFRHTRK